MTRIGDNRKTELEDESFVHADIAAETEMTNCGRVMFCMCNSFVTRNKVTHNQEPTKKCMILFMPGSILTKSRASMMNKYKDSFKDFPSSLGAHWSQHAQHNGFEQENIKQGITENPNKMSCLLHKHKRKG